MNTIIEKIRAEVERRKKAIHSTLFNDEYNDFLSFLDTLQEQPVTLSVEDAMKELDEKIEKVKKDGSWKNPELLDEMRAEQPVCDGLEEEIKSWHKRHFKSRNAWEDYSGHYLDKNSQLDLARHFYELGRQSKPKVSEGLKDVADTLAEEHGFVKKPDFKPAKYSWSAVRDVFIEGVLAGAEWQREQLMKEAVEGEVVNLVPERNYVKIERESIAKATSGFKEGDKVKIIIVKEEEDGTRRA